MPRTKQKKTAEEKEKTPRQPKSARSPTAPRLPKAEPTTPEKSEPSRAAEAQPRTEVSEKIVYVGQKPVKNYVMACMTSFNAGSYRLILKARGRAICKAVDTVELLRRTFMKNAQLQGINISTEEVIREGNRKAKVSTIEISIIRQ